jgi:hypothetical protein
MRATCDKAETRLQLARNLFQGRLGLRYPALFADTRAALAHVSPEVAH